MRGSVAALTFWVWLAGAPGPAAAADATIELSEEALNALANRVGVLSDGGVDLAIPRDELEPLLSGCEFFGYFEYPPPRQPAGVIVRHPERSHIPLARCVDRHGSFVLVPCGEPTPWQWWITDARFEIENGAMKFKANVRARIGERWTSDERTVSAFVEFDAAAGELRVRIADFAVPLTYTAAGTTRRVAHVDVAKLRSFAIPIQPIAFSVPLLDGTQKALSGHVLQVTPRYKSGRLEVDLDVGF